LERCRLARLTREQHILLRLGELIAIAECSESLARKAARGARGELHPKADKRFTPPILASMARASARDAVFTVAHEGLRWVLGADADADAASLGEAFRLSDVTPLQKGLVGEMDAIADALYGRNP
jgi:alkylation response protein AidB-like acyl-CoA dehydrogenase